MGSGALALILLLMSFIHAGLTQDSPRSSLTVTPDSPVFTGETVTLKCVIETHSDWRYKWYKGRYSIMLQSSDRYTENRDTLTIRGVITSDQGQYWCRGQGDKRPNSSQSRSVSLSVKDLPRSSLTVTPDSPVFTGETVTLKCVIETHSNWRYEWYKDSVMLQSSDRYTVNRDTLSIKALNESDQDQYWCRGQRDGRPNSSQDSDRIHLSVNVSHSGQISVSSILSFLLAACPYLLSTVVLLFKCYRARGNTSV
uniref:Ig-like domain-containing protein n=1 Tax=Cyprinus carpio TaxID=7962 RepID=A0A8C1P1M2_CYPCA